MQTLWSYLKTTGKPILLYGMGNGADRIIAQLNACGLKISGVFASDDFVRGQFFHGFEVITYKKAKEIFGVFIVLTSFGTSRQEVMGNIEMIFKEQELYIPDVPVYGDVIFDGVYYENNKHIAKKIKQAFYDKRSQDVFEKIINFKLTGKPEHLFAAEDPEKSVFENIISLKSNAVVFDLGAYKGDTTEKFLRLWPDLERIVAVEPDIKNFKKLKSAFENNTKVKCVNSAISNRCEAVFFKSAGGRNRHIEHKKGNAEAITIDSLAHNFSVPDFIKFDIEGEELNALKGAAETIKKFKPALFVSAYHKSEDIFEIPEFVLNINPNYKMYLRHFRCIPCWDTYYIFL